MESKPSGEHFADVINIFSRCRSYILVRFYPDGTEITLVPVHADPARDSVNIYTLCEKHWRWIRDDQGKPIQFAKIDRKVVKSLAIQYCGKLVRDLDMNLAEAQRAIRLAKFVPDPLNA